MRGRARRRVGVRVRVRVGGRVCSSVCVCVCVCVPRVVLVGFAGGTVGWWVGLCGVLGWFGGLRLLGFARVFAVSCVSY